jgi:8-oxo-dGTP diphosphatase
VIHYRDSSGKRLEDYPRPSVAVDTAVLTVRDRALNVVLVGSSDGRSSTEWKLPGTFLHAGETLRTAVMRALREKVGLRGLAPRQLHVFDSPERDDRGWVLSVAHVDVVPVKMLEGLDAAQLVAIGALPPLRYDHADIIEFAVEAVRRDYRNAPDPAEMLGEPFTIAELRRLHEAVLGATLLPDTFRRAMTPALRATGEMSRKGRGRPAELYMRR